MNLTFHNKQITGILTILPSQEIRFEDEIGQYLFTPEQSLRLKKVMGYNTHRIVQDGVCVSDLCVTGMNYLFANNLLDKDDIDAIVLVTQCPDYIMPPTSNVIQGILELKQDMICMDINQGCSGFIIGLIQAFLLLTQPTIRKVVLMNADVMSRKVSKRDRNSNPLIGDAASITIIEDAKKGNSIHGNIKMDGRDYDALIIPAGGFKRPSNTWTGEMKKDIAGNFRSLDNLVMKGDEVFSFVQREVPPMIESLLDFAEKKKIDVDYFMFHQPNKFMLNKLADKLGIPYEKMPSNIVENFGNASGVSIPTVISYNLGKRLLNEKFLMCLAGFGVGLTWTSLLMEIGELKFNNIIYH